MERRSGKAAEVQLREVRVGTCSKMKLQIEGKTLGVSNGSYVEVAVLIEGDHSWHLFRIVRAAQSPEVVAVFRWFRRSEVGIASTHLITPYHHIHS